MPFCASFDPCPKLTAVHVSTSNSRIHNGGSLWLSGARYRSSRGISTFAVKSKTAAPAKPMIGDTRREIPTSEAFDQFTPSPNRCPEDKMAFANPTPRIDPIKVCELDAGRPRYHVPKFQSVAEMSKANTMAKPAPDPTFRTSSTGRSATTANATAPLDVNTPTRFQQPDQMTAVVGLSV